LYPKIPLLSYYEGHPTLVLAYHEASFWRDFVL